MMEYWAVKKSHYQKTPKTNTWFKSHLRMMETPHNFLQKSTPVYTDPEIEN